MAEAEWQLRLFASGDLGIIGARQAKFYAQNYGWGRPLEALIYEISAKFLRDFEPGREQCWVADDGKNILGGVILIEDDPQTARLRLLHVEAGARGKGIGAALVHQCTLFAREAGYRRIALWTHTVLKSARRIYAAEGYEITAREEHDEFGQPVASEHWVLEL